MISKGNFLTAVETIKDAEEFYMELDRVCREHDVDSRLLDNSVGLKLQDVIVDILSDAMGDIDEFIPWWMYDCRYGSDHAEITVKDNATYIKYELDTAEKLYNFLVKYYG